MKLWLISQNVNNGYDTYDSAVVAAVDEETARRINPSDLYDFYDEELHAWGYYVNGERKLPAYRSGSWVDIKEVLVEYIGRAKSDTKAGVICASFNAG